MASSIFAIFLLMTVPLAKAEYRALKWSLCNSDPSVTVQNVVVTPMPIELPGPMHLTVQAQFNRSLSDVQLQLSIKRETFLINLPIPCLLHLGSCTYEIPCSSSSPSLLETMISEDWAGITHDIGTQIQTLIQSLPQLNTTACPIPPAAINIQQYTMNLPAMPSILSFFAAGDYSAHVIAREKSTGHTLLCLDLGLTVKEKEEPCTGIFCG